MTRGYTGHEHLVQFSLINMNGRLYDPILGRMLSPDNYTHGGSQGYNRYTYAMNNPLKYTDPSGQVLAPAILALLGGGANLWSNWNNVTSFSAGAGYFISGALGALTANPYTGAAITTTLNAGIALATGRLPQIKNLNDFLMHTGNILVICSLLLQKNFRLLHVIIQ
jgi:RHS repeat-associated protein